MRGLGAGLGCLVLVLVLLVGAIVALLSYDRSLFDAFGRDCSRLGGHVYQANDFASSLGARLCLTGDGHVLEARP